MKSLTIRQKLAYGVCDLGGNAYFTLIGLSYLFFLTDIAGLDPLLAGIAMAVGRVWDAVTDPLMGYISDRTHSRYGRRRGYIFAGAVLLAAFMPLLFRAPQAGQLVIFLYACLVYCLANTAYTMISIPYGALAVDMTEDFDERTSLNGYRMSFAVLGTFTAVAAGQYITGMFSFAGKMNSWTLMGLTLGGIIMVTALITSIAIREKKTAAVTGGEGILKTYLGIMRVKPFIPALLAWTCHIAGVNVLMAVMKYYFERVYRNDVMLAPAMGAFLGMVLLFIPVWVFISKHRGKKFCYNAGMLQVAIVLIAFFFYGVETGPLGAIITMAVIGAGFSVQYVMPYSILPDIVEYDLMTNGVNREGSFYGIWNFSAKLGQAAAALVTGIVLKLVHYRTAPNAPEALSGITALVSWGSAAFFLLGFVALLFYPISRRKYEELFR